MKEAPGEYTRIFKRAFNIDKIKQHKRIIVFTKQQFPLQSEIQTVHLRTEVVIDGPTRVFRIINVDTHGGTKAKGGEADEGSPTPLVTGVRGIIGSLKMNTIRSSYLTNTTMNMTTTTSPTITKATTTTSTILATNSTKVYTSISFALHGIGISLVDDSPKEIAYVSISSIKMDFRETMERQNFIFLIQQIQIDNQLRNAEFPVVMLLRKPSKITTGVGTPEIPSPSNVEMLSQKDLYFCQIYFSRSNFYRDIYFFHHFVINSQGTSVELKVDQPFLESITEYFSTFIEKEDDQKLNVDSGRSDDVRELKASETNPSSLLIPSLPPAILERQKVYFENFYIGPLSVEFSLKMKEVKSTSWLITSLGSMDKLPIQIDFQQLKHPFTTTKECIITLYQLYRQLFLTEVLNKLIGYADILGNPFALFSDVSSGIADFLYRPTNALVFDPINFISELHKGTTSLFEKSIYRIFHSTSNFSQSIGKLIATLGENHSYIKARTNQLEPRNLTTALVTSSKNLYWSVSEGVTGVFIQPWQAYNHEGIDGLGKGFLQGILGVVFLPTLGLVDFITSTTTGAKKFIILLGSNNNKNVRVRPARCFMSDMSLQRYSLRHALGQHYLWLIDKGHHQYRWHMEVDVVYLLSDMSLFCISLPEIKLIYSVDYSAIKPSKLEKTENQLIIHLPKSTTSSEDSHDKDEDGDETNQNSIKIVLEDSKLTDQLHEQLKIVILSEAMKRPKDQ
eukprot:TRINITY_DN22241_c0_g1_i2.p1 TRINITY_DN22241_c0_g1~~TRINITY_DN22241_c0_g1_i2.p1  ORF type:complete len:735 (-),score=146.25 TRINITY_DN22241_c0_g1_i2:48-2252(-)